MVGLDVLAFYKSFRYIAHPPFPGTWGVFLIDAGIEGLTRNLRDLAPAVPYSELRQLALETLLTHERYHFWIDAWALGQEITPLIGSKYKRYTYYLEATRTIALTEFDYEESLANYYTFQKLRRRPLPDGSTVAGILRQVLRAAPVPYSDCFFDLDDRVQREGFLALAVANGTDPHFVILDNAVAHAPAQPTVLSASIQPTKRWHPVAGAPQCPVNFVKAAQYSTLVQYFQGPKLGEFRQFITNYLAGTPLPRSDHEFFQIDNGERVKFPNPHDKEVRSYELTGTLHKAGMAPKEFFDARTKTNFWKRNCPRHPVKPPIVLHK